MAQAYVEQVALRYGMGQQKAGSLGEAAAHLLTVLLSQEFLGKDPRLQLSCQTVPGGLEFVVRDQGLPFDPHAWTRPEVAEALQQVQRSVDKLDFVNLGQDGKETRFRSYFSLAAETPEQPPEASHDQAEPPPVREIRRFRGEDADAVSRCIWRTYGYSYTLLDAVYIPERLIALNEEGRLCSLVAINEADEVVGHMSFERSSPESTLAVAGVAAVEPAYRSKRLASEMARMLIPEARLVGVKELVCFAVTSHPYSQRLVHSLGFRSSCLVLGASLFCFEGGEATQSRESLVGYHQALDPEVLKRPYRFYAPNRHRAMLESLCQHLQLNATFEVPPSVELVPNDSVLKLSENPRRKSAKIHVEKYGSYVVERIRAHARYLRMQDYRAYQLTLPLTDPYTFHVVKPLEKMGFFFSGIAFMDDGPCLLLQDLYGVTVDYSQLKVEDEMAQELLGYVRYLEPEAV